MNRNFAFLLIIVITIVSLTESEQNIDLGVEFATVWEWEFSDKNPSNVFIIQRLRPKLIADLSHNFTFKLTVELENGFAQLKDAKLQWKYNKQLEIGVGRRRNPFGLENIYNFWSIPGVDWSLIHDLFEKSGHHDRNIGVWVQGKLFQEPFKIKYDFGLYNRFDMYAGEHETSDKHLSSQIVYSPQKFLNVVLSLSSVSDTLDLNRCVAYGIGASIKIIGIEIAGEYASGEDPFSETTSEADIEGYQFWARYDIGRFQPYVQHEFSDNGKEKKHTSLGCRFKLTKNTRIKLQTTYRDKKGDEPYSEFSIMAHAKF